MLKFTDCLLIMIGAIHQAAVEDAVPHREGMAQLMIHYLYQKLHIYFRFVFLALGPLAPVAVLNDLFERNHAGPVLYGA